MTEIVFVDVTDSDGNAGQGWAVKVKDGKIVEQITPGQIPSDARAFIKQGSRRVPLQGGPTYADFQAGQSGMTTTSAGSEDPVGEYDAGADPADEMAGIQADLDAQKNINGASSNSSYGPNGIYDPNKPIKIDVPGTIIKGAEGRPISVNSVQSIPQGELTALGIYGSPGVGVQELAREAAIAVSNNDNVTPQQVNGVYGNAVRYAAAKDISVQAALRDMIAMGQINGGGGSGGSGGGGGPFATTSTTITQTDEIEAERILNGALSTYLGRRADADEVAEFVKTLNKNEKFNPTVTNTTGVRSGNNTTQTATQTGGFDSTGFAERWARSREGAAEYQAATTYMDAFQSVIDGMEY